MRGVDPTAITRASSVSYSGANCEDDGRAKVALIRLQATRLVSQLMLMAADSRTGRAEIPPIVSPAMLIASSLEKLLEAASEPQDRVRQLREAAKALAGGLEIVEEMLGKAEALAATDGSPRH
jgi:hypothetical protein